MLYLTTFGGAGVRSAPPAGTPPGGLTVQRRALALLALVAAAPATGISRDKVLAILWPESDEERGRNALRQCLHTLKSQVRAPDLLLGTDMLRLNPTAITSDLQEFEAARAAGRKEQAVAVYAGPFLDGFHIGDAAGFERWVDEVRSAYASEYSAMLEALARDATRTGEASQAVRWWRRLAAADPLDSSVALGLMEALVAAGDDAGALRHGQAHEALIREELGAAPSPAVAGVMDRLRARGALPAGAAERGAAPSAMGEAPPTQEASFLQRLRHELAERYGIEGELERSREGAVRLLRARDLRHERTVVLKVLNPAVVSMIHVDRFLREIKLTARLRHPHILPLLDSGEVGGRPWYALPETEGVSLRARLAAEGSLAWEEGIRTAGELAGALDHAHRHGVIHRDVCPENVVLTEGHALLTNLGVARAIDSAATPKLTETGMMLGSPAYMSPEQAAGSAAVDGRTDQYALACVVFEMLSGEALFSGPTPQAIMAKRAAPQAFLADRLGVLPGVDRILARALATDPDRRFPTAGEFARAIQAVKPALPRAGRRWLRWLKLG